MTVGLDLDGTALDFAGTWADRYADWFGKPVEQAEMSKWDNLTAATHFETFDEFFRWAGVARIWRDMRYTEGAEGFIDQCLTLGHRVVFLTGRTDIAAVEQTHQWFNAQPFANPRLYRFPAELRTNQARKSVVPCSVYIDDAPHVIEELQSAGKSVVVFDRPWNTNVEGPRIKRWTDMEVTVTGVAMRPIETKVKATA